MSSFGLGIGLKALLSSQSALETTGNNVSNANTPGYSRQSVQLVASPTLLLRGLSMGSGVEASQVLRTTDGLLGKRIVSQQGVLGMIDSRLSGMSQVESLLGEPGGFGLSTLMSNMFASLSSLASNPSDLTLRSGAVQASTAMAAQFNQLAASFATLKNDTAGQVSAQVQQVNVLAKDVVHLNNEIAQVEASGVPANGLRDQRDEVLKSLGSLVNITVNEGNNGAVTVLSSGQLLVGPTRAYTMTSNAKSDGTVSIGIQGGTKPLDLKSGSLAGLLRVGQQFVPGLETQIDQLAKNMILELNRAHATGIPQAGSFSQLTGHHALRDIDGDGRVEDELLAQAGLPFDVTSGELVVNVTERATGEMRAVRIPIDAERTTVGDLLETLNAIPHLSSSLDTFGRLQILAESGYGFDFSRRIDATPDHDGTFGGGAASLGTSDEGPFALSDGDTLQLTGPAGNFTVTFDADDFAAIGEATSQEIADVINAHPDTALNGLRAVVVGDRLALQTVASGATQSFTVNGGSSAAAFGWSNGTTVTGQNQAVAVALSGTYTGESNERFTFVPNMDGTIGTTDGLRVDVFGADGVRVATLDVGAGYQPGSALAVADGLQVSFGFGDVSATENDVFGADALVDSDTTDALVALGLNSFMTGTSAGDIALRADIARDPTLLATSMSGAEGDNRILLDMIAAQSKDVAGLTDSTFAEFYGDFVSGIGFEISSTENARTTENYLLQSLVTRREEISGVNIDEELINMMQFQQSYSAAARFIDVVNRTTDELMQIL